MIIIYENAELIEDGTILILDGDRWNVVKSHTFDDFGSFMDTFIIERNGETKEIYSYDDCETFTFCTYD